MRTFHIRTAIPCLSLALAAGACAEAAPTAPQAGADVPVPIGPWSLTTLILGAAATSNPYTLDHTSGNKAVVGPGGIIHVVYADGGVVRYTQSGNALTWTPPVALASGGASQPSVAVTPTGTVGVAYQKSSLGFQGVYYTHRPSGATTWHPPVLIQGGIPTFAQPSPSPSLAQFRGEMHLAFAARGEVRYLRFPPALAAPPDFDSIETANLPLPCSDPYHVSRPSIAIAARAPGSTDPLVRIAYFWKSQGGFCSSFGAGLSVRQRPEPGPGGLPWPTVGGYTEVAPPVSGTDGVSLSMAAHPGTGSFHLAFAKTAGGVGQTWLAYANAWTGVAGQQLLLPRESQVDVAAEGCGVRLALSDVTQGTGDHGPTWHRAGHWTAAGSALVWDEPQAAVSTLGRSPQAIHWQWFTGNSKGAHTSTSHIVFDESGPSGYAVAYDRESVLLKKLPPAPVCSSPVTPSN